MGYMSLISSVDRLLNLPGPHLECFIVVTYTQQLSVFLIAGREKKKTYHNCLYSFHSGFGQSVAIAFWRIEIPTLQASHSAKLQQTNANDINDFVLQKLHFWNDWWRHATRTHVIPSGVTTRICWRNLWTTIAHIRTLLRFPISCFMTTNWMNVLEILGEII